MNNLIEEENAAIVAEFDEQTEMLAEAKSKYDFAVIQQESAEEELTYARKELDEAERTVERALYALDEARYEYDQIKRSMDMIGLRVYTQAELEDAGQLILLAVAA